MKQPFCFRCTTHNLVVNTTASELRRSPFGADCCAIAAQRMASLHASKNFNQASIGKTVDTQYRRWKTAAANYWNRKCSLTSTNDFRRVSFHHLYSKTVFPWIKYNHLNSFILPNDVHNAYHSYVRQKFLELPQQQVLEKITP